jgi:Spy/CpxP family protein refolding chaperone
MQARPNHARFIANELNLTKDQEVQFKELRQQYSRQSQESREALGDHYKQIMIELGSPEPNEQLLDSLAKQVGILHIDQQRATINHFLSLRKICSFDQYEKLQELFIRMRNREQMGRREGSPRNQRQKSKE